MTYGRQFLVAAIFLFSGCGEEGTLAPNIAPDTFLTGSVPADFGSVPNRLSIFWRGADVDGTQSHYEYVLVTYPRATATADEVRALLQLPAFVPGPTDSRWTRHEPPPNLALVVLADTLRADPRDPQAGDEHDRWHTFWVRTIDNEGTADPTPAHVTFRAVSRPPVMWFQRPVETATPLVVPTTFVMNWNGFDLDPDPSGRVFPDPVEARWVLLDADLDAGGNPIGFPERLYDLQDTDWNEWNGWNEPDSTGQQHVVRLTFPPAALEKSYVFAVQGRDDGGAITPRFKNDVQRENNYTAIIVQPALPLGPRFTVSEDSTGTGPWMIDGAGSSPFQVAVSHDTVHMRWSGMSASHYGANVGEFRYGWNIQNPASDGEWTDWERSLRAAPPHLLVESVEEFRLQARDNLGDGTHQVSDAIIRFARTQ